MRVSRRSYVMPALLVHVVACAHTAPLADTPAASAPVRWAFDATVPVDRGDAGTRAMLQAEVEAALEARGWVRTSAEDATVVVAVALEAPGEPLLLDRLSPRRRAVLPAKGADALVPVQPGPGAGIGLRDDHQPALQLRAATIVSGLGATGVALGPATGDGIPTLASALSTSMQRPGANDRAPMAPAGALPTARVALTVRAAGDTLPPTSVARSRTEVATLTFWGTAPQARDSAYTRQLLEAAVSEVLPVRRR